VRRRAADPLTAARAAGLRYVRDDDPGIRRRRVGAGFVYVDGDGRRVGDRHTLARIRALVIPPAWRDVWICPRADGHVQAVGRDARGRKQYRYHAGWREVRDGTKFERLVTFARRLPAIRRRVVADLRRPGMPREKVLALVVRLLETTSIRIGNSEYARANGSFGLTTLRNHHVDVSATRVRFRFRGKAGKLHEIDVADRALARLVRKCQDLPGQELFTWVDEDGTVRAVGSSDVNGYLRDAGGVEFSAKDFRTWSGTVAAALALGEKPTPTSAAAAKRAVAAAIKEVAAHLGNTATVCRKSYVHPVVIDAFTRGVTIHTLPAPRSGGPRGLAPEERAVLALLSSAGSDDERRAAG
jgi:DNA topoisomerase I